MKLIGLKIVLVLTVLAVQSFAAPVFAYAQNYEAACDTESNTQSVAFQFDANADKRYQLTLQLDTSEIIDRFLMEVSANIRENLREPTLISHTRSFENGSLIVELKGRSATPKNMDIAEQRIKDAMPASGMRYLRRYMLSLERIGDFTFQLHVKERAREKLIKDALKDTIDVLRRRVDPVGENGVTLSARDGEHITIISPPVDNTLGYKETITRRGNLYFAMAKTLAEGPPSSTWKLLPHSDAGMGCLWVNETNPIVTSRSIGDAFPAIDEYGRPQINFNLNTSGVKKFSQATIQFPHHYFAIVLDDSVMSAPRINDPIFGAGVRITGDFTMQEAVGLAAIIKYGDLPSSLSVIAEELLDADDVAKLRSPED